MIYGPYLDREIEIVYDCDQNWQGKWIAPTSTLNKKEKNLIRKSLFSETTLWQENETLNLTKSGKRNRVKNNNKQLRDKYLLPRGI